MSEHVHVVNRKGWPEGPWDSEPDKVQWMDEKTGLPCLIVRNLVGALCGYVGVAEGHPYFEKDPPGMNVHGGITFSGFCQPDGPICHVAEPGQPDRVWWLGFDTAHCHDVTPGLLKHGMIHGEYRDLDYVKAECRDLAAQVQAAAVVE